MHCDVSALQRKYETFVGVLRRAIVNPVILIRQTFSKWEAGLPRAPNTFKGGSVNGCEKILH